MGHTWYVEPHFGQIHRGVVVHGKLQRNLIIQLVNKRPNILALPHSFGLDSVGHR